MGIKFIEHSMMTPINSFPFSVRVPQKAKSFLLCQILYLNHGTDMLVCELEKAVFVGQKTKLCCSIFVLCIGSNRDKGSFIIT